MEQLLEVEARRREGAYGPATEAVGIARLQVCAYRVWHARPGFNLHGDRVGSNGEGGGGDIARLHSGVRRWGLIIYILILMGLPCRIMGLAR